MVLARVEKLNPSHRFAAGSRPKGHRTFGLSLAPPIHQAMGGLGFSTLASTNRATKENTVHENGMKPWTMSTKRNYKLNYICRY